MSEERAIPRVCSVCHFRLHRFGPRFHALQSEMMPLQFKTTAKPMTITKQVPAGLLQALGLHKGDFISVRDESSDTFTLEITSPVPQTGPRASLSRRQAALARFALGAAVEKASTEEELDDARYEHLRAKHLK